MKSRLLPVIAVPLLMLAGHAAHADVPGWYIGAGAGWSDLQEMKNNGTDIRFDNGFLVSGFAGYNFGALRAEGEIGYRHHDVKSLSSGGVGLTSPSGDASALSFMANGIYSFFPQSRFTPYLGAGIGVARLSLNSVAGSGATIVDSDDTRFAYQGIAGVSYALTPSVSLGLDYRYFATLDPTFTRTAAGGGGSFSPQYHTHNVLLSLTYHFGAPAAPPPAPMPAAAPAPAPAAAAAPPAAPPPTPQRNYIVFFDFDRDTLTPEATKIVEQAASTFKAGGVARVDLTGYTDLAGPAKYNLNLSKRRADRVRALLVKLGVPADAITEMARGKENPRVPTADGVREPQNRRVEIVMP